MDLAVVMPVYNEQDCIVDVVGAWRAMLGRLDIDFCVLVLNDGSRDATGDRLTAFAADPCIRVIDKENTGHGPTILQGYRLAAEMADWVFQCDSDGEMQPDSFGEFWAERESCDAVFGIRAGRAQDLGRRLISTASRAVVRILFGKAVLDVNVPYRLMRSPLLAHIVTQLPQDTFAPNVIIAGALARSGRRIRNLPVPHEVRRTGTASLGGWRLWRSAVRAFWQVLRSRATVDLAGIADR